MSLNNYKKYSEDLYKSNLLLVEKNDELIKKIKDLQEENLLNKNKFYMTIFVCAIVIAILISIFTLVEILPEYKFDVNKDGEINAADYVTIKNYIMKEN